MDTRRPRMIVFEDDERIRALLERYLKGRGFEVLAYEDPSLCPLQQVHSCQCSGNERCVDMLLTDMDMPNVSGLDFIESQAKKGCKNRNIGIMSGRWIDANRQRARELGCAIFEKPLSIIAVMEWINKCEERIDVDAVLSDWFRSKDGKDGSGRP